jgi:DNA-binding CsgD family transcriptional regulator/PAS domain-containing protein
MMRSPEQRALPMLEVIYRAAVTPELWNHFLELLSDELDAPVIGMNLEVPGAPSVRRVYRVNSDARFGRIFAEFMLRGDFPWDLSASTSTRFHPGEELLPPENLFETDFYREYMLPQGLRQSPLGLAVGRVSGEIVAMMGIYPRVGARPVGPGDRAMLDLLAPHLCEAYRIHRRLRSQEQYREAVTEVMDRLPTGVIFVDKDGKQVASNRAAQRLLALDDGLAVREGRPFATLADSRLGFETLLRGALTREPAESKSSTVLRISRPSRRTPFTALVEHLHAAPEVGFARDAVAVIFVSDTDDVHRVGVQKRMAELYHLTLAEAELTELLCEGKTLDQAAECRGVTPHTARSQLRRVFTKTATSRQTDLVRLALTGVSNLRDVEEPQASEPDGLVQ